MPSSDQNIRDIAVGAVPSRLSVLLAGLLTLVVGVGVAIPSEGLSTPFGGDTVKAYPFDPLVNQWHQLREQIQLMSLLLRRVGKRKLPIVWQQKN